jgi:NAD(P)-dependent dehydrogenase (short-subunit alcohol dehydrogenase family)
MKELQGRVAVVTGAASGIGNVIATALAQAGANVVLADIDVTAAAAAAAVIEQEHGVATLAVPAESCSTASARTSSGSSPTLAPTFPSPRK